MLPSLKNGYEILVDVRYRAKIAVAAGDIICFELNHTLYVKRVHFCDQALDSVYVLGDNLKASTDSRHFGTISKQCVIGKVICVFSKKGAPIIKRV